MQAFTILPLSWTAQKIQEEFSASDYNDTISQKLKTLVRELGILSLPNPKNQAGLFLKLFRT